MAVGRLPLASAAVAVRVAVTGAVLAAAGLGAQALTLAAVGGPAALGATTGENAAQVLHRLSTSSYGTSPTASWWWLGTAGRHSGTGPDLLHTGGSALVVLGLFLLVFAALDRGRAPVARRLLAPLVAVGSATLTLYTLHVLLLGATYDWDGLREIPPGAVLAAHVAVALAVAALVGAPRRRGPLEALAAAAGRAAAGAPTATPGSPPEPVDAPGRADSAP
ncbi:hypothetical protein [Kineosporia sp. R_H_3]|uniref:hypothetical protein n=1 Tax=Kineosporia sp. R_H_3 TaxID=1961848 RepID=UPI000B4B4017|nr:hypothetical protein [Kineosporia sp. R_H_3]